MTTVSVLASCGQNKLYAHEYLDKSYESCDGTGTDLNKEAYLANLKCRQAYLQTNIDNVRLDEQGKVKDEILELNWPIKDAEKQVAQVKLNNFRKANTEKCKPVLDTKKSGMDPFSAKAEVEARYQRCLDTGKRE